MDLVGKSFEKTFPGLGTFSGIVDSHDLNSGLFRVLYEDGNSEELDLFDLCPLLLLDPSENSAIENPIPYSDANSDPNFPPQIRPQTPPMADGGDAPEMKAEPRPEPELEPCPVAEVQATPEVEGQQSQGPRKRRRKMSSSSPVVPRRSARRAALALEDARSIEEDRPVEDCGRALEKVLGPCVKLELPPSSRSVDLDGLPVLDVFSVYACLRSFSTALFLSPFRLEAFVAALKCDCANSLLDSIHFSVLHALRPHLEFLSKEGSLTASVCLRSLNWELLDLITWPVYLAEYLLMHGSELKPSFSICHLKLLDGEYYGQPASVKLEVLRCLCDDVIEAEAIRLELTRRTSASEVDLDTDRPAQCGSNFTRKSSLKNLDGSFLLEEVPDLNSDECCLCKMDGSLICCDGCPAAYHSRCVGITKDHLPEGDWYCPECMMCEHDGWKKVSKALQGAELLGVDPHGRLYFACFGYLLVSDSCNSEPLCCYYNRNDLNAVIEALKSSASYCSGIITAISTHWVSTPSDVVNKNHCTNLSSLLTVNSEQGRVEDVNFNENEPKEDSFVHVDVTLQSCITSESFRGPDSLSTKQSMETTSPSLEKISPELKISEISPCINEGFGGKYVKLETIQERIVDSVGCVSISGMSPSKSDVFQLSVEPGFYINYYFHGLVASSVLEALALRSTDNMKDDMEKFPENIISTQLKAISKKYKNISWLNIQKPYLAAEKENCGWCFPCKNPSAGKCLFCLTDDNFLEGSEKSVCLQSTESIKYHLSSVTCRLLSIEDRLRGILSGPWEKPHHSEQWRKSILEASDVSSVKSLLLTLELNLRRIALSSEWLRHVDSTVAMGSGSHVFTSAINVSAKHGVGRKRSRKSALDVEPNLPPHTKNISRIYWWRGGSLSRQVFQWKLLPRSLAFKCGRQAGCSKVPGVLYPDGSEFSKISKYTAWRASIEMSSSVAQLAFHVRDLDWNIRWSDLGNHQLVHQLSNESKKLGKLFKKVIIRRKCIEGSNIKYLLDFGRRKVIPDVVTKHGVKIEEPTEERKKYWLAESFVPLYLLKAYEVRRLARKGNKTGVGAISTGDKTEKLPKRKGFAYLFSRAEKTKHQQCGYCNNDVAAREAVICHLCKGFFHKKHAKASKGSFSNRTYSCIQCHSKKCVKKAAKAPKIQKGHSEGSKIPKLRRSQRAIKKVTTYAPVQRKKLNSRKKGTKFHSGGDMRETSNLPSKSQKLKKSRSGKLKKTSFHPKQETYKKSVSRSKREVSNKCDSGISWFRRQRTSIFHAYWLKGILWAKKSFTGRNSDFCKKNILLPSQNSENKQPVCSLCHEAYDLDLIYISCEICQEWFHGDAFGLTGENSDRLLGFKCPSCLKKGKIVCSWSKCCRIESKLHEIKNNEKEGVCVNDSRQRIELPTNMHEEQRYEENEYSSSDEPLRKKQRTDSAIDANVTVLSEDITVKSEMGLISVASHVELNHHSCRPIAEDEIQMEVV